MAPGDHRELHRPFQETLTYIEFLGMSGVGKTAACELMIRAFRARAVRVESVEQGALRALLNRRGIFASAWLARHRPSRLRPVALRLLSGNAIDRSRAFAAFSAQYPDFIDYLFEREETRLSFGGRDELIVLLWLLSSMWWFQLATDGAAGVNCCVGCDEGFSQRGLSLLAYREVPTTDAWERSVREYFQCMPKPDTVVVPFASFDVALERMGLRHQGYPTRVQGLLPSEQRAVFERASRCVELGADELGRRGVRVIRLENEGTREDLRRSVEAVSPALVSIAGA